MSQVSKLRQSRDRWKRKASARAENNRYLRKQLARVRAERDRHRQAAKQAPARQRRDERQPRGIAVQDKTDLVCLALQLFLVARIGFRAVSRVLATLGQYLGIARAPCAQTIINWITRLSLVRIQSAARLRSTNPGDDRFANGRIWLIDTSIGLGTGKILAVLALDSRHHQLSPAAPGLDRVQCLAVAVAASWNGETIAALLQRVIGVAGRPAAYLKDGGTDLQKAVGVLAERGLGSRCIDDLSHLVAKLLKRHYRDHPQLANFLSACGRVSGKFKQTILACLAPPKVHTKARFMNLHRLVTWAERLLALAPVGGTATGATGAKLAACLDQLPACQAFIEQFRKDARPLLECQQILKTKGLSHATLSQCEPVLEAMASSAVRSAFTDYLKTHLEIATRLGVAEIGLPISSDPIESLFGVAKQHGTGELKDANRIAIRLPAYCGAPTRAEAQQVLAMGVAREHELIAPLDSLTKQRREVLPNPAALERLGSDYAHRHVELIPGPENRSNNPKIFDLSNHYEKEGGPGLERQNDHCPPTSTGP